MTVDKSETRVRKMFGEIAGRYDLLNHLLSLGIDVYWRWRTVRKVPPAGHEPILDLCTGTGDLALAYYHAGRGQTPVVGADFCHPMLVIGHDKARAAKAQQVTFVEADAQRLPFGDNSFQIVSVAFGLAQRDRHRPGPRRDASAFAGRAGRIAVLELSPDAFAGSHCAQLYGWYFRHVLPRIGQLLARNAQDAYNYLPLSVGEFPSGEALAERIRRAGASQDALLSTDTGNRHFVRGDEMTAPNVVLAISGASGAVYALRLLDVLLAAECHVHLSISQSARLVLRQELGLSPDPDCFDPASLSLGPKSPAVAALPAAMREVFAGTSDLPPRQGQISYHHYQNLMAPIASGSFLTSGMVICPCSGSTLGAVVHGTGESLIHRAASVHLKERRKLILVPRETPLSTIQLENMRRAAEAGAIVLPAMPGFYHGVASIRDLVDFVVGRICDQLGLDNALVRRWGTER